MLQAPLWTGEWGPEEVKEGTLTTDGVKLSSVSVDIVSKATQTKPGDISIGSPSF